VNEIDLKDKSLVFFMQLEFFQCAYLSVQISLFGRKMSFNSSIFSIDNLVSFQAFETPRAAYR
jgi:hypothetical protein